MEFTVDWEVRGTSTVEVTWRELTEAGINPDDFGDDRALFEALNKHFDGELLREAADDWDERDEPTILGVMAEGRIDEDEGY